MDWLWSVLVVLIDKQCYVRYIFFLCIGDLVCGAVMTEQKMREIARKALKGQKRDFSAMPEPVRVILERGFTAEQINAAFKRAKESVGKQIGTAKV